MEVGITDTMIMGIIQVKGQDMDTGITGIIPVEGQDTGLIPLKGQDMDTMIMGLIPVKGRWITIPMRTLRIQMPERNAKTCIKPFLGTR